MSSGFTKENTIPTLRNAVLAGQKMGAYALKDTPHLLKALQYTDPEVTEKPDLGDVKDPELFAVSLLLQAIAKAQAHGGERAYSIEDAALLWEMTEFWIEEGKKAASASATAVAATGAPAEDKIDKGKKKARRTVAESDDDEEETEKKEKAPEISIVDPRKSRK